jgi:hypothetical protein
MTKRNPIAKALGTLRFKLRVKRSKRAKTTRHD